VEFRRILIEAGLAIGITFATAEAA